MASIVVFAETLHVAAKADGDAKSKIAKTEKIPICLNLAQAMHTCVSKAWTKNF